MSKYIPNNEDVYSTKPCAICGRDVIDENKQTCCDLCEQQWIIFQEDCEWMMAEYYKKEGVK